jgi:TPR repeat protein
MYDLTPSWEERLIMDVIRRNIRFVSFTTLLLFATSASAEFSAGVAAYERGDYETAFKEFKHSADQGHAPAQHNLGWLYDQGHGAPRDYARAVMWYRKAALQGYAPAQYNLGWMYDKGHGVPQDYAQAAMWYRRAATQGHAPAQNILGMMHFYGQGVARDYEQAVQWYRKAATRGHAYGQYNLAKAYATGQGAPRDYVQAHLWISLAASRETGEEKEIYLEARASIAKNMSKKQIAEAQRLAAEWKPQKAAVEK